MYAPTPDGQVTVPINTPLDSIYIHITLLRR